MSVAALGLRCRQCHSTLGLLVCSVNCFKARTLKQNHQKSPLRSFHSGAIVLARQTKKVAQPTKKQLAAKARKKAAKAKKSVYDSEKMKLSDAINVLRVCAYLLSNKLATSIVYPPFSRQ